MSRSKKKVEPVYLPERNTPEFDEMAFSMILSLFEHQLKPMPESKPRSRKASPKAQPDQAVSSATTSN
jgi:hypothetical protein